jgi:hypothetical protein
MSSSITTMMFGRLRSAPTVRPFGCSLGGGETTAGVGRAAFGDAGRSAYQPPSAATDAMATAPATTAVGTVLIEKAGRDTLHDNTRPDRCVAKWRKKEAPPPVVEPVETSYPLRVRRLVLLIAVLLVNLPAVHQAWTDHRIDTRGRDVEAVVLDARTIQGRHLVDYRLPRCIDPAGNRFSASVDDATYELARTSDRRAVRVIPGQPGANRPDGEVTNSLLVVAALSADAILLLIAGLWLYRRRVAQPASRPPVG